MSNPPPPGFQPDSIEEIPLTPAAPSQPPPIPMQPPGSPNPMMLNYATPIAAQRGDLRTVASKQKSLIQCILVNLIVSVVYFMRLQHLPELVEQIIVLSLLAAIVIGAVYAFMLAIALYGTGGGIVMGILTLIPFFGLIFLAVINSKATATLRQNGIAVGFMGADVNRIPFNTPPQERQRW